MKPIEEFMEPLPPPHDKEREKECLRRKELAEQWVKSLRPGYWIPYHVARYLCHPKGINCDTLAPCFGELEAVEEEGRFIVAYPYVVVANPVFDEAKKK